MRTEPEVADLIIDAGLSGTMLEAAIHAVRCGDFLYLQAQYRKHVQPLLTLADAEEVL